MEDRHASELASAIKGLSSALSGLGISIMFGLIYVGCMVSMAAHH